MLYSSPRHMLYWNPRHMYSNPHHMLYSNPRHMLYSNPRHMFIRILVSVSVSIFRQTLLGYYAEGVHANFKENLI